MDKRIRFGTKEEHNARRERAFLALSPSERLIWFLRSFTRHGSSELVERNVGNFIIRKRRDGVRG